MHGGRVIFGEKLLNTQCGVGRCTCKSPIMKRTNTLSLQKTSLKLNAAFHNNASWCTDTDGLLEYSSREGSLYYQDPPLQEPIQDTTLHLVIISRGFCGVFLGLSLFLMTLTILRILVRYFVKCPLIGVV